MLANSQDNPLTSPAAAVDPLLTFADAATARPGDMSSDPLSLWKGTAPAPPEIIPRLIHIFVLAAAIMVMILVAVAAGEGLTRIFHGR